MKKIISSSLAIILAAALCGCSDNNTPDSIQISNSSGGTSNQSEADGESSGVESAENSKSESSENQSSQNENSDNVSESAITIENGETFLVGLEGERIKASEITQVFTSDGSECAPENLTEELFSAVLCDGFAYVAEPTKFSRNNRDNADIYDSDEMLFGDVSSEPMSNYRRINVGDTVGGLKLVNATANFARGNDQSIFTLTDGTTVTGAELGIKGIFFSSATADFEGELSMEGYICKKAEDEYGFEVGDLIFVPCDGEAAFPVMSYRLDGIQGFHHIIQTYSLSDLVWANEYGYVSLGNQRDTSVDISMLPDDGSFIKANVTVSAIHLASGVNWNSLVKAELNNISEI